MNWIISLTAGAFEPQVSSVTVNHSDCGLLGVLLPPRFITAIRPCNGGGRRRCSSLICDQPAGLTRVDSGRVVIWIFVDLLASGIISWLDLTTGQSVRVPKAKRISYSSVDPFHCISCWVSRKSSSWAESALNSMGGGGSIKNPWIEWWDVAEMN